MLVRSPLPPSPAGLSTSGEAEADAAEPTTSAFAPNFSNDHFTQDAGDWTAVALMNRGVLLAEGCAAAPMTCSVLTTLSPHLQPRPPHATEVGVRFLKLALLLGEQKPIPTSTRAKICGSYRMARCAHLSVASGTA